MAESPVGGGGLLGVFAHPDDESLACGGLLALTASHGLPTAILCVTRGEHGSTPEGLPPEAVGHRRLRELEAAARVLGVTGVHVLDYEDGYLPWSDEAALEAEIARCIRQAAPDVVVTFDEDGLYWHPDHIAVHARTTSAVAALSREGPALYYVTMPKGSMRAVQERAGAPLPILGIADAAAFGSAAPPPSLELDVRSVAGQKLAALRCHASQVAGGALERLRDEDAPECLGLELFRRAPIGDQRETWLDRMAAGRRPTMDPARAIS